MTGQGGLLTEYGIETQPDREHFPTRNRIVAGMCDALIVVETAEQGGSMITATFAREFKKEVFAVPGRIHDTSSLGCHKLLKERKARLLDRVEDLAEVFRWKLQAAGGAVVQRQLFHELSEREQELVSLLQEKASMTADQLAPALGVFPGELATLLLELEFKGLIRTLPGHRYMLVGQV
jgi:DNA processing protein